MQPKYLNLADPLDSLKGTVPLATEMTGLSAYEKPDPRASEFHEIDDEIDLFFNDPTQPDLCFTDESALTEDSNDVETSEMPNVQSRE